jgi:hypothetical protein
MRKGINMKVGKGIAYFSLIGTEGLYYIEVW